MAYLNNIKKQYCITFFHALIPAYVIERLFWQQRGMDVQMVIYCEMIYAFTITICEIPSGILADKFSRKYLISICNLLSVMEFIILLFSNSFIHFALAVFFSGIGKSLSSGSSNALLYDSLVAMNRQETFEKELGIISSIDLIGSLIAALSGSLLAIYLGLEFNYIVSIFSMVVAFCLTLSIKEPPILNKKKNETKSSLIYTKEAFLIFKSQPLLFIYCLTGAMLSGCVIYLDEFWQLILNDIGVPILLFGLMSAIFMIFRIPGNLIAHKLKAKFDYSKIFNCIIVLSIIGYISIFLLKNIYCILPILLLNFIMGIVDPLVYGYLHHHTDSYIRATVESLSSLGLRLVSIGIGLIFGYVCSLHSIFYGFLFLGILCFIYGVFFYSMEFN